MDCTSEEDALYRAAEGLEMVLDSGDLGTFEEMRARAGVLKPQIVHLAGQAVSKDGAIYFAFEGGSGMPDLKSASDISQVLEGLDVQCLIMSGCQGKSQSFLDSLCLDIARSGVPLAIAWAGSMAESSGQELVRKLYKSLTSGQPSEQGRLSAQAKSWEPHTGSIGGYLHFPFCTHQPVRNLSLIPRRLIYQYFPCCLSR